MNAQPRTPLTILRLKQVRERLSLSRSTIYDKLNPRSPRHDPSFPKQISLGGDAVGWLESQIEEWIEMRIRESRKRMPAQKTESPPALSIR